MTGCPLVLYQLLIGLIRTPTVTTARPVNASADRHGNGEDGRGGAAAGNGVLVAAGGGTAAAGGTGVAVGGASVAVGGTGVAVGADTAHCSMSSWVGWEMSNAQVIVFPSTSAVAGSYLTILPGAVTE